MTKKTTLKSKRKHSESMSITKIMSEPTTRKEKWDASFKSTAKDSGFYEKLGSEHKALFVENDSTLVVAFENLDDARQDTNNRMPWAMDFLASKGWSALGMMAHGPTWYRDPAVWDFFDTLKAENFFDRFDRVVFYGASMGGYGATAFSSACPGAHVIAVNPQATLSRDITGSWEKRFRKVWHRDFDSRYGNGAEQIRDAAHVRIFYDPIIPEDAMHAALYTGPNVEKIRCRHMGHGMLSTWRHIGVLSKIITGSVAGSISAEEIYAHLHARTHNPVYQKRILSYLLTQNRPHLLQQYCKAVLDTSAPQGRPHFANAMQQANRELRRRTL